PNFAAAQDKPAAPAAKGGAPKEAPIAKVNGVAVPASRLDLLVQQQKSRGTPDNPQTRQMLKDELVNREVLAQEAQRAGFGKKAEVQAQVEMARQEIMVGAYLRDWVQKHPVSEDDVQKEYERAKSQTGDKEYHARHILVDTEDEETTIIGQLTQGTSFAELAQKNSIHTGTKV